MQTVSATTQSDLMFLSPATERVIEDFHHGFEKAPFLFEHQLSSHPLFTLDAVRSLAFRMASLPGRVYHDSGNIRVSEKWGRIPVRNSLEEALDGIETADAWVILKSVNLDPEYTALLDSCIEQLSDRAGRNLAQLMGKRIMSILVSSPNRVTPYHIDGECNFLLQVRGGKTIYVFDGTDRSVLTEQELERFWTCEITAAQYREASQCKAKPFELKPGLGVHVPLLFPHWVKNGPNVSISVSINFEYADKRQADLYRANYYLRKLGLRPSPPGRANILDSAKLYAFRAFDTSRSMLRRTAPGSRSQH